MRKIIAFEGIDGSGKTVQFNMLSDYLIDAGYKVARLDFPDYDSFFGKIIGKFLAGENYVDANTVDPMSMSLWYAMDRFMTLKSFDDDSDILITNRYTLSNAAYQSIRCSSDSIMTPDQMIDWVFELEHGVLKLPEPDIYFFLDTSKECAEKNVESKGFRDYVGDGKDIYESRGNVQKYAREAYLKCARRYNNIHVVQCTENGVMMPKEKIHGMVTDLLKQNNIID